MISRRLMNAIKHEGFAKVAAEVQRADGEATRNLDSMHGIVKAAAVRFLVDELHQSEVYEGLLAFEQLEESK